MEVSHTQRQRRQDGQDHTQIRHQAQETADETDKIKVIELQEGKDHGTEAAHKETDEKVPADEAAHHLRDLADRDASGRAVLRLYTLYGCAESVLVESAPKQ